MRLMIVKRRLFWKIFLGFWLTFFIITQGVWLVFNFLRPSEVYDYMRDMANLSVAAASSAIRAGGEPAFEAQAATWPRSERARLHVALASAVPEKQDPLAQTVASAPDGTNYRVSYFRQRTSSRGVPPTPVMLVAALASLLFSASLALYLTNPIQRMQLGFEKLAGGDFSTRLGPAMGRRRDEIADLAYDFDQMAMRLEELVTARDRLLADVSHELRTPLARLNLAIGLVRQDPAKLETSLDRISVEAAKLDEMVGELLTLSKLESGQARGDDYFDFAEIVKVVVQDAHCEAAGKGVSVMMDVTPEGDDVEWIVRGSGRLVARAIENVVRNAVRYSPENGTVHVILRQEGERFSLRVRDEGPGVSQEAMATLFKPFGVSADGFGFGLGLAIAQRALVVNGGTIAAHNRQPRGLEMAVTLPASA